MAFLAFPAPADMPNSFAACPKTIELAFGEKEQGWVGEVTHASIGPSKLEVIPSACGPAPGPRVPGPPADPPYSLPKLYSTLNFHCGPFVRFQLSDTGKSWARLRPLEASVSHWLAID